MNVFFPLLVVVVFFNPASAFENIGTSSANVGVDTICKKTSSPSLCISTLKHKLHIRNPSPSTILLLLIQSAKQQTSAAEVTFNRLSKNSKTSKKDAKALKNCVERYGNSQGNYNDAVHAVEGKDWGTVNIELSAVIDWYFQCGTGQDDPNLDPNIGRGLWSVPNTKLKKLVDVCFDVLKQCL